MNMEKLQLLKAYIEEAYALELLEYHNKNHLANGGNPKLLSEEMQNLLSASRAIVIELLKNPKGNK
jgi:hypothetical protein